MSLVKVRLTPARIAQSGLCIGCGACASRDLGLTMHLDRYGQFKPGGPSLHRLERTLEQTCPFSPVARDESRIAAELFPLAPHSDSRIGRYEAAYVGYVEETGFRENGSSGGLTTWVACELLRLGLVDGVAHVGPGKTENGEPLFGYRISRSETEVCVRAKSRYFPVELSGVLAEIRARPGRYAIVGIPCFIKAVNLLRAQDPQLRERITHTLGLFCGHMKSARLAESFAWQLGAEMRSVSRLEFRRKEPGRPANWYRAEITLRDGERRAEDWWNLVDGDWGAGFFQNSACNFCDDVVAETADISFGDAWVEPYQSDGRGTNVVIVRNAQIHRLIEEAAAQQRLWLKGVDADFVVETQAAGFRQRREGLAYRLAKRRHGIVPRKRVAPAAGGLPSKRRAIYTMRHQISSWSHLVFLLARMLHRPTIYSAWARLALTAYQALAYSRGTLGALLGRVWR